MEFNLKLGWKYFGRININSLKVCCSVCVYNSRYTEVVLLHTHFICNQFEKLTFKVKLEKKLTLMNDYQRLCLFRSGMFPV